MPERKVAISTTEPAAPNAGDGWMHPITRIEKRWDGSNWITVIGDFTLNKLLKGAGAGADPTEIDVPTGDMAKSTYDPDGDGKIALAQLVADVCSETELGDHAALPSVHHTKYTHPTTGSCPQTPKAHKDTHDPQDGSDPLDAAAPVKVGAANAEGSSHSLARADHVHEREHAKTTKASEITSEQFPVDRMPRAASGFLEGKGVGSNPAYSALAEADIPAHMAKSKLAFTANKLLKGAGAGADPTEIDVPTGAPTANGSYVGDDTVNRAIPHGLGVTPKIVILARAGSDWDNLIILGQAYISHLKPTSGVHAVTIPDSTNFYVGNSDNYETSGNKNGATYLWATFG